MSPSKKRIYLSPPHMSGNEMKYIQEAFDQNWIAPLGPNVDAFEKSLANYCGVKDAAALSSGTAAIHLALIILGVKPGDEVIAPSFTFSATINPIIYLGATPVLVDSERETWNMDPELLEKAIRDRLAKLRKPKAILVVHLYGMPAKMDEIMEIANKYEIPVIEDAAEALGSRYKEQPVGSFGKLAILSFNGNKIITTSGGGALLSDDANLIKKARYLSTQARDETPYYQHSEIGYNYRMSNILAGIGRGQLEVVESRVQKRRDNFNYYLENLENIRGISFLKEPNEDFFSNYWLTTILFNLNTTAIEPQLLQSEFEKMNIEIRPLWKPMHLQPIFKNYPSYLNGASESMFQSGICLPSGSNLNKSDKDTILKVFKKHFKEL